MSCRDEQNCNEARNRKRALMVLGVMMVIFIVLSAFSFLDSRGQVTPDQISYGAHKADDGKRVFQSFNCMGCHTIVGNGAYLGPDLTKEYRNAGPAWLAAFLPSAGGWPTAAAVRTQLTNADVAADAGVADLDAYYAKFPGARERIERRGGHPSLMPNLPISGEQVGQLIAFLKYTSAMNNEGWPPEVKVGDLDKRLALLGKALPAAPVSTAATAPAAGEAAPAAAADPVARGKGLAEEYACLSCHALDGSRKIGPGWGGLYGSQVKLDDGSTVTADDAYIAQSITDPDAKVVEGYPRSTMPNYSTLLSADDVQALVAYIRSLEKQ